MTTLGEAGLISHWIVCASPTPPPWDSNSKVRGKEIDEQWEKMAGAQLPRPSPSLPLPLEHHGFFEAHMLYKFQPLLLYLIICVSP